MFRIGAAGTRREGRLRALAALGGARRRARPGSWESLEPRGILAERRGQGERAVPRFFSTTVGRITCKNFSRPSPCPAPEEGGRHVKLISSCLLLLRGWRGGAGGQEAVFFQVDCSSLLANLDDSSKFSCSTRATEDCRLARKSHFYNTGNLSEPKSSFPFPLKCKERSVAMRTLRHC